MLFYGKKRYIWSCDGFNLMLYWILKIEQSKELNEYFFQVVATLGVGGFGRVELVKCRKKPGVTYALKCLKKQHIVETQQQEHVFSEKNILMSCRHIFITK